MTVLRSSALKARPARVQRTGLRHLPTRIALLVGMLCLIAIGFASVKPTAAQVAEDGGSASYITPFPGGERYKLAVIGDEFGEGIHGALLDALGSDPRLDIDKKPLWFSGLTRPDTDNDMKNVTQMISRDKPNVAVIMFGSLDRWSYRAPDGRKYPVGTSEWRKVYTSRIDTLIQGFKASGIAVYWVGLPIMRRNDFNEAAQAQNEVFRERAYLGGVRYIDVYQSFADEQGEYNAYGPDLAGKLRLLRDSDGMHMTEAGYQKLAHFVERELKRDLNQAKNERAIPLAGGEAEQALVNPTKHAAKSPEGKHSWLTSTNTAANTGSSNGGLDDQPAENGRINLKTPGSDGNDAIVPIEIFRPAIPAAVIALVTRRESPDRASQMGDQVIDQIPGGLTVMSSITPAGDGAAGAGNRRKISPAQAPYFRVLVKGERIAARPGRADDTSWPRNEPEPLPPKVELQPTASAPEGIPLPVAKPGR